MLSLVKNGLPLARLLVLLLLSIELKLAFDPPRDRASDLLSIQTASSAGGDAGPVRSTSSSDLRSCSSSPSSDKIEHTCNKLSHILVSTCRSKAYASWANSVINGEFIICSFMDMRIKTGPLLRDRISTCSGPFEYIGIWLVSRYEDIMINDVAKKRASKLSSVISLHAALVFDSAKLKSLMERSDA